MLQSIKCFLVAGLVAVVATGCGMTSRLSCFEARDKAKTLCQMREPVAVCGDPLLEAARCVTTLEDQLRNEGTISAKTPDVWGDGNLMHSIQEFDQELAGSLSEFDETIQAYIANSDVASGLNEIKAAFSGNETPPALPEDTVININGVDAPFALLAKTADFARPKEGGLRLEPTERERQHATYVYLNQAIRRKNLVSDNTRRAGYGLYMFRIPVSILPGEDTSQGYCAVANFRARVKVTAADVKYSLPRLAIADIVEATADDIHSSWNGPSRADRIKALIKDFESKIKTRTDQELETFYVESLRKNARDALNELAKDVEFRSAGQILSDLQEIDRAIPTPIEVVSDQGPPIPSLPNVARWLPGNDRDFFSDFGAKISQTENQRAEFSGRDPFDQELSISLRPAGLPVQAGTTTQSIGFAQLAIGNTRYHDVEVLRDLLKDGLFKGQTAVPSVHEIRHALFSLLGQVASVVEKRGGYDYVYASPSRPNYSIIEAANIVENNGSPESIIEDWRNQFTSKRDLSVNFGIDDREKYAFVAAAGIVAMQCGIVDLNIKRLLEEMELNGTLPEYCTFGEYESINFFSDDQIDIATDVWRVLVENEFPLQVFTLEPQVEEQNLFDASSRLREMQFALAYSVAQGSWGLNQRVALSRQLARESTAIGVNRTAVGFVHGLDTFGWYFYPRAQSPENVSGSVGMFNQLFTTTSPTAAQDRSTLRLEPGIRECEVLVAMPSIVSGVEFDVTTNWESLAYPGRSKNSYEEQICQGALVKKVRDCLQTCGEVNEYRPGDYQRLCSRVDQLENMLGLQTLSVRVPYEYEQSGVELFDQGNKYLVPQINGYYGLQQIPKPADSKTVTASFFITGKNFHPTLTHVIVGGHEAHSLGESNEVEILNRELIRVEVTMGSDSFSSGAFEVRVGTPGGLSGPLSIAVPQPAPTAKTSSAFDWNAKPKFKGYFYFEGNISKKNLVVKSLNPSDTTYKIQSNKDNPFDLGHLTANQIAMAQFCVVYELKLGTDRPKQIRGNWNPLPSDFSITDECLLSIVQNEIVCDLDPTMEREGVVVGTTYLRIDTWPLIKLDTTIEIELKKPTFECPPADCGN